MEQSSRRYTRNTVLYITSEIKIHFMSFVLDHHMNNEQEQRARKRLDWDCRLSISYLELERSERSVIVVNMQVG
jgi:hypothetical protein